MVVIFLVSEGEVDGEVLREVWWTRFYSFDRSLGGSVWVCVWENESDGFVGKRVGGMCCCVVLGRWSG